MKYKLTFKTGNQSGAGTDATVSFQIVGSKSVTKEVRLTSKLWQFEKGSIDSFFVESENIGTLEKIIIWHNNQLLGADWFLNEIIVESPSPKSIWYFPVFKWIKKEQKFSVKAVNHSVYNFEICTGTLPGSGSNENIQLSLIGSKSYTPFIDINPYLPDNEFKTGHTEVFSILAEDVGKIKENKIKSLNSAFNSNWFLNKISIKKESENNYISFPYHKWIKPGKVYSSTDDLHEYTVKLHTGDVAVGGTDANVSMIIYGTRGQTNPILLNELIARNAFEAGNIDFVKLAYKNLGSIKKIKVWHNEKWLGDGWFLNKISIKNHNTGVEATFPFYSWLDKSANPRSTKIELTRIPILSRPFYAIAHMVNTPAYVEEALDLGSNGIECDITPHLNKDGNFTFEVFHGFRPDFDPDKINLMERSIARTPLPLYLKNLKKFEEKYLNLSLVIYDFKLDKVKENKLELCGIQLGQQVMQSFYLTDDINRIFTIFSIGKKKSTPFFDGVMKVIPKKFIPYIGFDLSMENFQTTEKVFENRNENNFWWGRGIASTVPKSLKHFIPQFLIAANKRTKRGIIKKIYYWTLDDPDSMARILVTKLDGIIVNDPLKLLKVLEKEEFKHAYRLANRDDNPFTVI